MARLKCGRNERAKMCFEKALEEKPEDPECRAGMAIAMYRLQEKPEKQFSVDALKQAMELNSQNQYEKVLLALKLQKMGKKLKQSGWLKMPWKRVLIKQTSSKRQLSSIGKRVT